MSKKLTQEQVEHEFTAKGCELLEKYEGIQKTMKYRCKCGSIAQTSLGGFRNSTGCYKCSEASDGRRLSYDDVRQFFIDQGCELLDKEYPNNNVILNYRCKCGNVSRIRFRDFKRGRRCQDCKGKTSSAKLKTDDEKLFEFCSAHGCKFVRSWIKCKKTRIEYICKCGNVCEAYWTNFKNFPNCWECGKAKKSGDKCYMYDPDREAIAFRKKFRKTCGRLLKRALEATGQAKTDHTYKMLGYTPKELQEHIFNHPNFKNCGSDYHIDHIFPIQAFLNHGVKDLTLINKLCNLQPLPGPENISKADSYDEREFVEWLKI
jgi:hypothetical protein